MAGEDKIAKLKPAEEKLSKKKMFTISSFVIVLIIAFSYYYYSISYNKPEISEEKIVEKSIAVLPFKNLSDDKSNQYFADGVMDDILIHLSTIKEFKVISGTSMEQYRETKKTIPEIAKELNVSYIIESSIQKNKDSVRIITQLIDAKNDTHIWAKNFEREFKNIFALESDIAKQIASELRTTLSPEEKKQIGKEPTDNLEAYKLYLKGRFFWNVRTKSNQEKSIYYYKKALELDSTYALAFAGLSDSYFIMAYYGWYPIEDSYEKGTEYAIKALSIDNNISEAHSTLGAIIANRERKWDLAIKEMEYAISLNPNNATAHQYYSEILGTLERNNKAIKHIDIALDLNPYNAVMTSVSSRIHYRNNDFRKSIEESKKYLELKNDSNFDDWGVNFRIFKCYLHLNNDVEVLKKLNYLVGEDPQIDIDNEYKKFGINGAVNLFKSWVIKNKPNHNLAIASLFTFLNDKKNALDYLEKAFYNDPNFPYLLMKNDFKIVEDEPRYIALLEKVNLENFK